MLTNLLTDSAGRPAAQVAAEKGTDVDTAFREYIDQRIPVGRLGRPADVGALATWLASDDSAFMTGAAINPTGGEQVFFWGGVSARAGAGPVHQIHQKRRSPIL